MEPFGYTIFCDDIRYEIGGKMTFIGTYRNSIAIHNDAFRLVKLSMFTTISMPRSRAIELQGMKLRFYFPGDVADTPSMDTELTNIHVKQADLDKLPPAAPASLLEGHPISTTYFVAEMENIIFKENGLIRIRGLLKSGEILYLGTIAVHHAPIKIAPAAPSPDANPNA